MTVSIIQSLIEFSGEFRGKGINHEKQDFIGQMSIRPVIQKNGIEIDFSAIGIEGTLYHQEKTILALGHNDKPSLWSLNSNAPYMFQLELRKDERFEGDNRRLVFGFGDPKNKDMFREEIQLDLHIDGRVGYHYYWGMPGGDFAYRSGLIMKR